MFIAFSAPLARRRIRLIDLMRAHVGFIAPPRCARCYGSRREDERRAYVVSSWRRSRRLNGTWTCSEATEDRRLRDQHQQDEDAQNLQHPSIPHKKGLCETTSSHGTCVHSASTPTTTRVVPAPHHAHDHRPFVEWCEYCGIDFVPYPGGTIGRNIHSGKGR